MSTIITIILVITIVLLLLSYARSISFIDGYASCIDDFSDDLNADLLPPSDAPDQVKEKFGAAYTSKTSKNQSGEGFIYRETMAPMYQSTPDNFSQTKGKEKFSYDFEVSGAPYLPVKATPTSPFIGSIY